MKKSSHSTLGRISGMGRTSLAKAGTLLCAGMFASYASAQDLSVAGPEGDIAVPIEIAINTVNAEVRCEPPELRLPSIDVFEFRFINNSEIPVMFAAPDFFIAGEILESAGSEFNHEVGGFLIDADSVAEMVIRTPPVGEYYYACSDLGEQPSIRSTGYLMVLPES